MDLETFAARRVDRLTTADDEIAPLVREALENYGEPGWVDPIVVGAQVLFLEMFEDAGGTEVDAFLERFRTDLVETMAKTTDAGGLDEGQVARITKWVGTYAVNAATFYARPSAANRWTAMGDEEVRPTHSAAAGQTAPIGGTFTVGAGELRFPGDPTGPIEEWINCRCLLVPVPNGASMTAAAFEMDPELDREPDEPMDEIPEDEPLVDDDFEIPIHGVLAPEGVLSGDGRKFAEGALTTRELPMPLLYQTMTGDAGHVNSVSPAIISKVWRTDDGMMAFEGAINPNHAYADEFIDGIAFGNVRGVSVDIDEYVIEEFADAEMGEGELVFSSARIAASTVVPIPAFQEAYVALGHWGEQVREEAVEDVVEDDEPALVASAAPSGAREEARRGIAWYEDGKGGDGLESATVERARKIAAGEDLTDEHIMRMRSFFARHEVDKKGKGWSPDEEGYPSAGRVAWALWGGDPGKSFADAEAKRIENERAALVAAAIEQFAPGTKDGPGWLTNPRATARIRRYWVRGKGAAKIRWGVPGDFNRCRRQLAKYVNPAFLAGTCANMHKEALGVWPGRERGGRLEAQRAPLSIVASVVADVLDASWFHDPELKALTPVTVTDDGRIFGHLAGWDTCHIGIPGVCTTPPASNTSYAYFRTGAVSTTEGDIPVGQITMGTGHASLRARAHAAAAHYDNTGTAVADVAAGEDAFGIWIAGAVRDGLAPDQVRTLKAAALSGDWRDIRGNLELVGALAVNVPGFPIPRTALAASAGHQESLVASGVVDREARPALIASAEELVGFVAAVADEIEARTARRQRVAEVRQSAATLDELARERRVQRLASIPTLD